MATIDERLQAATTKAELAADILEQVANGDDTTTVDTAGGPVPSIAKFIADEKVIVEAQVAEASSDVTTARDQAVAAADVAQLSVGIFSTTGEGITNTTSGQFFSVPSADANEYLILYKNNLGTAVEQKRYPTTVGVPKLVNKVRRYQNRAADGSLPNGSTGAQLRLSGGITVEAASAGLAAYGVKNQLLIASGRTNSATGYLGTKIEAEDFGKQFICSVIYETDPSVTVSANALMADSANTINGSTLGSTITRTQVDLGGGVRLVYIKGTLPASQTGAFDRLLVGFSGISPTPTVGSPLAHNVKVGGFSFAIMRETPDFNLYDWSDFDWTTRTGLKQLQARVTTLEGEVDTLQSDVAAIEAELGGNTSATLVLAGTGDTESYIEVGRDGKTIKRTFRPFPVASKVASSVFDFRSDQIDGVAIKSMSDDVAPYRALGTTIGANHGYYMSEVTATGHGKVTADIGSIYSNGGTEWVLIGIVDANTLYIARRSSGVSTVAPAGTYTYVSGGSGSANITVASSGTLKQLYPPFANRVIKCFVDGVEVTATTATTRYTKDVVFMESYDILERADVIAWYEASGSGGGVQPTGTPAISVSISYVFDHEANCTIYTDFLARKNGIALDDIMFLQAQRMATGVDGTIEYYIPKALPVTHEGTPYDYANIDSSDTAAWTTRLDFTPARCEPTGILCDRVIQLSTNYGFAMGYLPVQSTSLANRRTQATVKALQLSNSSGKIYLSAIDKGSITLNSGDYFSTIGYRNVLVRSAGRTCCYAVRTNGEDYLYVDWHSSGVDRVPVPADMAGRSFEVVEKSSNVTVLSQALTNSLVVDVANTATYGYLILKVT